ncbi:MAG: carboxypeptidase-like regulatory domain-containing protein, partial [Haloplanus sp.]
KSGDGKDDPTDPEVREPDPPDPDLTTTDSVATRWKFLYTGDDPAQRDVDPTAIDADRVSTFHGTVVDRDGTPLSGVTVRVDDRPEFGYTATRDDGRYDMLVNGGGRVTLEFAKQGYLPVQRSVNLGWNRETTVDEVALVQFSGAGTDIEMNADTMQVVEGTQVTDDDGTRQAVVIVPPKTTAMRTDDGTAAQSLTVRTAEYTVGERGPAAMPGELPPSVAYTYATEFFAELPGGSGSGSGGGTGGQAFIGAGSEGDVQFDQSVIFYLENFLGFPVGTAVPVGSYDRDASRWVPSDDGIVLKILRIEGGRAVLDLTGDGSAADPTTLREAGISVAERSELADRYTAGQELWRTPLPHFTPWDCNWASQFPPGSELPPNIDPRGPPGNPFPCN